MITNGSVTIEDGKKAAEEYAPARKVSVTIAFGVPEGQDGTKVLDYASAVAQSKVSELLGVPKPAAPEMAAKLADAGPGKAQARGKKNTEAPREAPEAGSKADLEARAIAEASKPAEQPTVPVERDDNDLSDLLGDTPAPAPISDKEMSDACIAKANKMKSVAGWEAKKIRTLIEEFTGQPGKRVQDIAADKRASFMNKLDALK